jgi:hypothetical protein
MANTGRSPSSVGLVILVLTVVIALIAGCSEAGIFDTMAMRLAEFDWAYETDVSIDPGTLSSTLTDVPVLVRLTPDRIDYSAIRRNGADLEFYDGETGALLPFEIEDWVPGGESSLWVRIPRIEPGTGALLRIRYGRWNAGDGHDPAAVWSNGYLAVWHFSESESPFADSTGNANTARKAENQADPVLTEGIVGSAVDFSASDSSALAVEPSPSLTSFAPLTIEFATSGSGTSKNDFLIFRDDMFVRADGDWQTSPTLRFQYNFTGPDGEEHEPADDLLVHRGYDWGSADWHVGAVTWDGTAEALIRQIYDNGAPRPPQINSRGGTGTPVDVSGSTLTIGNGGWAGGMTSAFNGSIDEVRIAGVPRSADWILVQARSLRDLLFDWTGATTTLLREVLPQ